jgi:hypothetical protein
MPNSCECDLYISGPNVAAVLAFIKGEEKDEDGNITLFDFNKVIPMPTPLLDISSPQYSEADKKQADENIRLYGHPDWYDWAIAEWGTKWNAWDVKEGRVSKNEAVLHFSTAWAPPQPVIEKLAKLFPFNGFALEYFEQGVGFQGAVIYSAGKEIASHKEAYSGPRGG